MNTALVVLSLVAAVAAEAPYHLPRPAGHAPAFHLPAPAPAPPRFAPQPQLNLGYQYQEPSFNPTFVQHAPQQAIPVHQHHQHHQHAQAYFPPAPAPQPFQVNYPQPQPISFPQPGQSYGLPHSAPRLPLAQAPIHHNPSFASQPAPQFNQPISFPQPQQFSPLQGYNYQQPQALPQFSQQIPLHAQPLTNNFGPSSLSSYQVDSHQYNGPHEQTHRDALDSVVVGRLQNIIKENEHSSAKNAGYLSLVSGVSLENAKPSVEISSFVQTAPLFSGHSSGLSHGSSFGSSLLGHSAPSGNYGLPSLSINSQPINAGSFNLGSSNFLPQNKPAPSYGPPH